MNFQVTIDSIVPLLQGAGLTLGLTAASLLFGLTFACVLTMLARSWVPPLRWGVSAYVFVFRGTPLLVQLSLIYYGLGQFAAVRDSVVWPILREPMWCAILALSLNTAAYSSEIIRGGLASVPRGLVEAAKSLGMRRIFIWATVILPLTIRQALPAYGNEIVLMVKASALASTVTLLEITGIARRIISQTLAPVEVFIAAGAIYLAINFIATRLVRWAEHAMTPDLRVGDAR